MVKTISKVIYFFLKILDIALKKLFKRSFLIWFKDFIEEDGYIDLKTKDNKYKIRLFNPNYLTNWLYTDIFSKEPETLDWIDRFNCNNETITFWDIGSNIGIYSIYAAMKFKKINVFSFEPSTSNLRVLSRNIFLNKLEKKIKIIQLPLSEESFKFSFLRESSFIEGASNNVFNEKINFEGKIFKEENSYQVLGTSAEHIIKNKLSNIPNYVKIDVDGIEHKILKGFGEFLSHQELKSIQVEINENFKEQKKLIFELMKKNNFNLISKKRNENYSLYKLKKFNKIFNYYFEK